MRSLFDLLAWTTAFSFGGFSLAVVGYAIGSFVLMRRHTAARRFGVSFRELVREIILAVATQPLLPLFYVFGHRMGPRAAGSAVLKRGNAVIFVHGYMQNRVNFLGLARVLSRRGIGPLFGFNYPWFDSIDANAKRLDRFVERVCAEANCASVDLVCHSMGGLVAIEMLREGASRDRVRRCVTIATPHAGVAWRGPLLGVGASSLRRGSKLLQTHAGYSLNVPTLSVFSSHDNVVHPKETAHLGGRGGRDVEVDGLGHLAILFSPVACDHVASFLLEPTTAPVGPSVEVALEELDTALDRATEQDAARTSRL